MDALLLAHEGGWWWGGGLFFLIFGLIAAVLVWKYVSFRGWGARAWPDASPEAILKRRLAGGEISEADYDRLTALLRR